MKARRSLPWLLLPVLWCAVLASGMGAVYCVYRTRALFMRLDHLDSARDALDSQWGRLLLEQSTWSTYGYVERVATTRLHMSIPNAHNVEMLPP